MVEIGDEQKNSFMCLVNMFLVLRFGNEIT